ncbi:MAG: hypothetical protein HC893_10885 [Chloroflexaceae bacterium]|nr:hypothetical protein [Chloroflexaceae bacterium]
MSHDAAEPVGYTVTAAGATIGLAVDLGSWDDGLIARLRPADLLIIEANHCREQLLASAYPLGDLSAHHGPRGHLDNQQCGELITAICGDGRPRAIRLAHLSDQANNAQRALKSVRAVLQASNLHHLPMAVLPRQAARTHKHMPIWSSDSLLRQLDMFG